MAAHAAPAHEAPGLTPRTAERRRRLLEVAAACFARDGFGRTRIEDIAAAAGVSRALVHHYFGSKEALAREVQDHMLADWSAAADRAIAEADDVPGALAAWLRLNLADTRRPLLLAILADDAASVRVGWEQAARRAVAEWGEKLAALLARGIARGELRQDLDPVSTAEALRAMQIGMMQHLFTPTPFVDVSDARHLEAATAVLVDGLRPPADRGAAAAGRPETRSAPAD